MNLDEGLAAAIVAARTQPLPDAVERRARQHLLDSLAASVSGSTLPPGRLAGDYVASQGGRPVATVLGTSLATTPVLAAMANGMSAHADESDDSHERAMCHPGCAIVPGAFAAAEARQSSLGELLAAVALGYDVGVRINLTVGIENIHPWEGITSSHALAGVFGAAAASSLLFRFDQQQTQWTISYAAQQFGGLGTAFRDREHIEKAFVFGGLPARNGIAAAEMVSIGFTGVDDPLSGSPGFFDLFPGEADLSQLLDGLGSRYEICSTNVKKYPVGSPMQTILQAVEFLLAEGVVLAEIESVEINIPSYVERIVNSLMPNISARYLAAVTLIDGQLTFAAAHDYDRMSTLAVRTLMEKINVIGHDEMGRSREARVVVTERSGVRRERHVMGARGSVHDPMSNEEILAKARDLMTPVLGSAGVDSLLELIDRGDLDLPVGEITKVLRANGATK